MTRGWILICLVAACGGDGVAHIPDAPSIDGPTDPCVGLGGSACFELPSAVLLAHEGTLTQAPDNFCTRNARTTTTAITLSGKTIDETGAGVMASLAVYYTPGFSGTADASATSDSSGAYSVQLPTPVHNELDVLVQRAMAYDTRFVNAQIFFSPTTITDRMYPSILRSSWTTQLASIAEVPQANQGAIVGTANDCDERFLEFAVVTVSSTSSRATNAPPTFIPGTRVYYVDGVPPVPVSRASRKESGASGGFVVLGLQPGSVYLQSWGFANAADLAMGMAGLKIVGEKQITIAADVLTSTALTPRSGP